LERRIRKRKIEVSLGSDGVSLLMVEGGEAGEEYSTVTEFNEMRRK
jgi:mRNA degradation ribonuclease J1/J2